MRASAHRHLYNADCNTLFYNPELWQPEGGPYSARAMQAFVDRLADSGVDTLLMNPNTQVAWFPSRAVPTILDRYVRGSDALFRARAEKGCQNAAEREMLLETSVQAMNLRLDLVEAGVDWLAEIAVACRRRGIAPWLSVRMNDLHGAHDLDSYMNAPLYRDAANRVDSVYPGTAGLNFASPAVREYMLEMMRELVEEYDYEGLELDWMRFPVCCAPVATPHQLDTMTTWTAELRALCDSRARATGKPYPMGVRMPVSFGLMKSIGLDVKAWIRRGLLDFLGVSNSWQTTWTVPYDRLRAELGEEIALYGSVEVGPSGVTGYNPQYDKGGIRHVSATRPFLYGNAAGKLALGADGIETFNFFVADSKARGIPRAVPPNAADLAIRADYDALHKIADLDALRGEEKLYTFASIDGPYVTPLFETPDDLPMLLEPGGQRTLRLPMCAEPAECGLDLIVQVIYDGETLPEISLSFNESWPAADGEPSDLLLFPTGLYTHHMPGRHGLNFHVPATDIREGWNEITLYHAAANPAPLRLVNVEVGVRR